MKSSRGFTIVELVIAIFILFIAVFGVYSAFSTIVTLTLGISDRLTAAYLAQEGIEIIRNMRDYNWVKKSTYPNTLWNDGLSSCPSGCEADYTTGTAVIGSKILTAWTGDPSNSGNLLKINTNGFYVYGATGSDTKFKRKITITLFDNYMKVNVRVFWNQKGNWSLDVVEVEDNLYNWY